MKYLRLATTFDGYFKQGNDRVPPSGKLHTLTPDFISPFTVATSVSAESHEITGIYFQKLSLNSFFAFIPLALIGFVIGHIASFDPAPLHYTLIIGAAILVTIVLPLIHLASLLLWSQSPAPYQRRLIKRHYPHIPTYLVSRKVLKEL
jgi:hypothetical protein